MNKKTISFAPSVEVRFFEQQQPAFAAGLPEAATRPTPKAGGALRDRAVTKPLPAQDYRFVSLPRAPRARRLAAGLLQVQQQKLAILGIEDFVSAKTQLRPMKAPAPLFGVRVDARLRTEDHLRALDLAHPFALGDRDAAAVQVEASSFDALVRGKDYTRAVVQHHDRHDLAHIKTFGARILDWVGAEQAHGNYSARKQLAYMAGAARGATMDSEVVLAGLELHTLPPMYQTVPLRNPNFSAAGLNLRDTRLTSLPQTLFANPNIEEVRVVGDRLQLMGPQSRRFPQDENTLGYFLLAGTPLGKVLPLFPPIMNREEVADLFGFIDAFRLENLPERLLPGSKAISRPVRQLDMAEIREVMRYVRAGKIDPTAPEYADL